MKRFLTTAVLLVVMAAAIIYWQLGAIVKSGTEEYGPQVMGVAVELDGASISPVSGGASLSGFRIGQPDGYGEGYSAELGSFEMDLEPQTIFSDHIIINRIVIEAPALDIRIKGKKSNFEAMADGMALDTQTAETGQEEAESQLTLTIKELIVTAPQASLMTEGLIKVDEDITLADFTLTNLGTDEEGLAPKEIARHIMDALKPQITKALIEAQASGKLNDLADKASGTLQKGLEGLLKKKKDDNDS